ncbi:MAG TPA: hypothetical protein VHE60_05315 [Pyrinomonadaceae bacterium]|nr:hypothetical protein [Pyrinomonadaceae bacterium]
MKNLKFLTKTFLRLQVSVVALLLIPLIVLGQNTGSASQKTPTSLTGKYQGAAKAPSGDVKLTLDLVEEAGKFSGRITTAYNVYEVVKGQLVNGLLSLELDAKGSLAKLAVRQKEDKLVGELSAHGETGAIELTRVVAKDEISGEWDATADANGQPFPFTLNLKVDGEKVTGGSNSELGQSTISSGSWKDGKLVFILDSSNGQIAMVAAIVDGKLVGDFDLSGQMTGKWAAIKKKP